MKKLSLVMAAAMCVTVGGVYASWSYAEEQTVNYNQKSASVSLDVTEPTYSGADLAVTLTTDNVGLTIDGTEKEVEGVMTKNVAMLITSGYIDVVFTPADTSDMTSVQLTVSVVVNTHAVYDGEHVFKFADTGVSSFTETIDVEAGVATQPKTYTVEYIFQQVGFGLNGDIVVPTPDAHTVFSSAVSAAAITIMIEAVPVYPTR